MAGKNGEISPRLAKRVADAAPEDPVEVVIELHAPERPADDRDKSLVDRTEARRESFDAWSATVVQRLKALGGTIVGHAWINGTLKVIVPAGQVAELVSDEKIERIDAPEPL